MILAAVLVGTILGLLVAAVIALAMLGNQSRVQLTAQLEAEKRITETLSERVVALEKRKLIEEQEETKKPTVGQQWGARRRVLESNG